ncbi:MAG: ATP synthase F1 subunit gamma [bacterium]
MNLLALKNRIKSVKNIGQVTKAMELVAATKMRRAQQRALDARFYTSELKSLMRKLLVDGSLSDFDLAKENVNAKKNLLIIVGPSKGLAGPLVSNLSREAYKYLLANPDTDLIALDKKGVYLAEKSGKDIIAAIDYIKTSIEQEDLEGVFRIIKEEYTKGTYKKVSVVFTHFINTLVQKPMVTDILPITIDSINSGFVKSDEDNNMTDILIEPGKTEVLEQLFNQFFENTLFLSVLDSISSEYSARMIAMKNAGDNAKELKEDLTLEYNQSRQAAITQQILEIAGATAAMESSD